MAHTISYEYRSSPANMQLSTKKLGKLRKWHKTGPIGDHPIIYLGNGKHPVPLKINEEYPLSNEMFVPSYPQVEWECDHLVWDRGACQSLSQLETGTLDLEVKLIRWKFIKFVQSTVTQKKWNKMSMKRVGHACYVMQQVEDYMFTSQRWYPFQGHSSLFSPQRSSFFSALVMQPPVVLCIIFYGFFFLFDWRSITIFNESCNPQKGATVKSNPKFLN